MAVVYVGQFVDPNLSRGLVTALVLALDYHLILLAIYNRDIEGLNCSHVFHEGTCCVHRVVNIREDDTLNDSVISVWVLV